MPNATAATIESGDGTPSGRIILTTVSAERTVVRLEGEIDMSMSEELGQLLLSLPTATAELVLDVAGLTYCDSTLARFVARMSQRLPVSIVSPNRRIMEYLLLVDLAAHVRLPH